MKHLEKSKKADILVVSITADKYVKKGPDRPIYNENQRSSILSNLEFVDYDDRKISKWCRGYKST